MAISYLAIHPLLWEKAQMNVDLKIAMIWNCAVNYRDECFVSNGKNTTAAFLF